MDQQEAQQPHHPIESLMKTAMQSIKEMVDVNTVVGDAVETNDGSVIIPISQVACGFAAGGENMRSVIPIHRNCLLPVAAELGFRSNPSVF